MDIAIPIVDFEYHKSKLLLCFSFKNFHRFYFFGIKKWNSEFVIVKKINNLTFLILTIIRDMTGNVYIYISSSKKTENINAVWADTVWNE